MTSFFEKEDVKAFIKSMCRDYLKSKGIDIQRPFRCLNPEHQDEHPSMSFDKKRDKVHCFSCGADYDTFDLVGIFEGLNGFQEVFNRACEIFDCEAKREDVKNRKKVKRRDGKKDGSFESEANSLSVSDSERDLSSYFVHCHSLIKETDYWGRRGLSAAVVNRFNLGFDPVFKRGTGGKSWGALIVPVSSGGYVARNTDDSAEHKDRIRRCGGGAFFNVEALKEDRPIFVVEGELDALSVIEVGGAALSLGSVANVSRFLRYLEDERVTLRRSLLIALDNDQEGAAAARKLLKGLAVRKFPARQVDISGTFKDPNEALVADREAFADAIRRAELSDENAARRERDEYLMTSAAALLPEFIGGINDRVSVLPIPTGFSELDIELDGGLYPGLYIVGAISSLGKTSFILQIADQIAKGDVASEADILIFSLEMSRAELMAKSISRETLLDCVSLGVAPLGLAKGTLDILNGRRYEMYSNAEIALIERAGRAYGQYAGRIFISEGMGEVGAERIRSAVEKHIRITGRKPVVFIDYLQLLAPFDPRGTDKQNVDRSVMELKRISRDFRLPVVAVSSLNRANYSTPIAFEAFKESGAIEYSSDVLIGLQLRGAGDKSFDVNAAKAAEPRRVEAVILKNRNGRTGRTVEYKFYARYNCFEEDWENRVDGGLR